MSSGNSKDNSISFFKFHPYRNGRKNLRFCAYASRRPRTAFEFQGTAAIGIYNRPRFYFIALSGRGGKLDRFSVFDFYGTYRHESCAFRFCLKRAMTARNGKRDSTDNLFKFYFYGNVTGNFRLCSQAAFRAAFFKGQRTAVVGLYDRPYSYLPTCFRLGTEGKLFAVKSSSA